MFVYLEVLVGGPAAAGEGARGQRGQEGGGVLLFSSIHVHIYICKCMHVPRPKTNPSHSTPYIRRLSPHLHSQNTLSKSAHREQRRLRVGLVEPRCQLGQELVDADARAGGKAELWFAVIVFVWLICEWVS